MTTVVLAGRDDRLFPLAFQRRIARERLGRPVTVLDGGTYSHLAARQRSSISCTALRERSGRSGSAANVAVLQRVGFVRVASFAEYDRYHWNR